MDSHLTRTVVIGGVTSHQVSEAGSGSYLGQKDRLLDLINEPFKKNNSESTNPARSGTEIIDIQVYSKEAFLQLNKQLEEEILRIALEGTLVADFFHSQRKAYLDAGKRNNTNYSFGYLAPRVRYHRGTVQITWNKRIQSKTMKSPKTTHIAKSHKGNPTLRYTAKTVQPSSHEELELFEDCEEQFYALRKRLQLIKKMRYSIRSYITVVEESC